MPQILFSFTINPSTQAAVFAGNIDIQTALSILTQLTIADAISKAKSDDGKKPEEATAKTKDIKK